MSRKKKVYIVRHGQSDDNAKPVFQAYDSPLSTKGKQQAQKIAERTVGLQFDTLLSSPQLRAKQTAEIISSATSVPIELSELFVERFKPMSIDGKSWDDPEAGRIWRDWEKSLVTRDLRIQDGENYDDIVSRADAALRQLEDRQEESILVVSHGHFIRTVVARVMLGDQLTPQLLKRFYELTSLENTGISVLHFRDAFEEEYRWRLWSLNDHAHVAE